MRKTSVFGKTSTPPASHIMGYSALAGPVPKALPPARQVLTAKLLGDPKPHNIEARAKREALAKASRITLKTFSWEQPK